MRKRQDYALNSIGNHKGNATLGAECDPRDNYAILVPFVTNHAFPHVSVDFDNSAHNFCISEPRSAKSADLRNPVKIPVYLLVLCIGFHTFQFVVDFIAELNFRCVTIFFPEKVFCIIFDPHRKIF